MLLAGLAIAFACAEVATAAIPPEVPETRASIIFSPFPFNTGTEDIFESGGPACRSYGLAQNFQQTSPPMLFGTKINARNFLDILRSPSGITFLQSHGDADSITIEAFPGTDAGFAQALERLQEYEDPDFGPFLEFELSVGFVGDDIENPDYWTLDLHKTQLSIVVTRETGPGIDHGLIYAASCGSYGLRDAFVAGDHLVRAFIGFDGCPLPTMADGLVAGDIIFNSMSGVRAINSSKANFPLTAVVPIAQSAVQSNLSAKYDSESPAPTNMRLYNAPRIVLAKVDEDTQGDNTYSHSVYHYQFGDEYPYNPGNSSNYPGQSGQPGVTLTRGVAGSAPLRITLKFSEPMHMFWPQTVFKLRYEDGTEADLVGSWGSTYLEDDTWRSVPIVTPLGVSGNVSLHVRARARPCGTDDDSGNQELDLNGDGSSSANSFDTSVSIAIALPDSSTRTA